MLSMALSPDVCELLLPRQPVPTAEWVCNNVILPPGSEIKGPFNLDLFPHCREPLECFDDPSVRIVSMQWGSRVGKTVLMLSILAKVAATNPSPMAFADADQNSTERVIKRLWKILARVPALEDRCPPPHARSSQRVEFPDFTIHGAWSGSASSAADYAALVVVKNEVDKMTKKRSDEADFFQLMDERAKGFLRSKIINGSTPGYKGRSRIETARLAGDNRRREVPCPRCNHFQTLKTGNGKAPGGLRWEKLRNGLSDKQLAMETAWYECEKCSRKILDHERRELLNAGLWVKEGQMVTGSGKIVGNPVRAGAHASFGPLGTHYSLLPSITWGRMAWEFLDSRQDLQKRRNYHNSWEAMTWDEAPQKLPHSEMAERLCRPWPKGIIPEWGIFLTRGVDVLADGHTYRWIVIAWGHAERAAVVDWGTTIGDDSFRAEIYDRWYRHADGGPAMRPTYTLVDSGDGEHTNEVYNFCQPIPGVFPCKGSQTSSFNGLFVLSGLKSESAKERDLQLRLGGKALVIVNTERTQWWMENVLYSEADPAGPAGLTLPPEAAVETEIFDELTNEYAGRERNENGYSVHDWKKLGPNELRDAARYAKVAADWFTNRGEKWATYPERRVLNSTATTVSQTPMTMPDGRPYLLTER